MKGSFVPSTWMQVKAFFEDQGFSESRADWMADQILSIVRRRAENESDEPLPTEPGFYVGDYAHSPSGKILIELLASPKGQWVDNTDSRYLTETWVRQLGNLTRLVPASGGAA